MAAAGGVRVEVGVQRGREVGRFASIAGREVEGDEPVVKIEFSGMNTIHAVWLTLDQSKRLAARLLEVSAELSRLRTALRKRAK